MVWYHGEKSVEKIVDQDPLNFENLGIREHIEQK